MGVGQGAGWEEEGTESAGWLGCLVRETAVRGPAGQNGVEAEGLARLALAMISRPRPPASSRTQV